MPFTFTDEFVVAKIKELILSGREESENPGWIVVPYATFHELERQLGFVETTNARARDLQDLNKAVFEVSQTACNPRPLCTLLHNLVFTAMKDAGMPGYQASPQIRQVLHQLLWLLDCTELPAYGLRSDDPRHASYSRDADAVAGMYFDNLVRTDLFPKRFPEARIEATAYHTYDSTHRLVVKCDDPAADCVFLFDLENYAPFGPEAYMDEDRRVLSEKTEFEKTPC